MSADKNEVHRVAPEPLDAVPEVPAEFEDEFSEDLIGEPVNDPTIAEEDK